MWEMTRNFFWPQTSAGQQLETDFANAVYTSFLVIAHSPKIFARLLQTESEKYRNFTVKIGGSAKLH
jgi:hypothetical protein